MPIGITIFGANELFREGFKHILADGGYRAGCFRDEAIFTQLRGIPDRGDQLLLIDPATPAAGVALCRQIRRTHGEVRIILMCDEITAALRADAADSVDGLLLKTGPCRPFIDALDDLMRGKRSPLDPHWVFGGGTPLEHDLASLTRREREIIEHLVRGKANKVIARDLQIAEATVKVHIKMLLRKLRVENRTQVALRAVRCGVAELPSPIGER